MCGRFSLTTEIYKLAEEFFLENAESIEYQHTYNVAPGQKVLAVIKGEKKNKAGYLHWGLVPSWAKDKKIGYKMINARSETLKEKVSFRRLLARRRCLILADSFYEWKLEEGVKKPVRFLMKDQVPFAFAGLWDRWNNDGEELVSCTVITTQPNELVKDVHDRMPVILKKEHVQKWIDQDVQDQAVLNAMLTPFDARLMEAYEVSSVVNSPRNNDISCISPI